MKENQNKVTFLAYGATIAALYVVLTLPFASFAFGAIQFRVAEALTVLPLFTPAAVPGVTIGCFLANLLAGAPLLDVVFGSLATLLGALLSYRLRRKKWLVCLPPILSNTLVIPWVLRFAYGLGNLLIIALSPLKQQLFSRCHA